MNSKIVVALMLALAAVPLASADSGSYVAPMGATGFCNPLGDGNDVGVVCELACEGTCVVTVSDAVLNDAAVFVVCDWNGVADEPCSDPAQGSLIWTSSTGVIDIFIVVGTAGSATTTY